MASTGDGEQIQNTIIQTEEESGIYVDINGVYYFISHDNPARYMNLGPKSYGDFLRHFGLDKLSNSERIRTEASFIRLYGKGFVGFEDIQKSKTRDDVERVLPHIKMRIRQLENTAKLMKNITIVQESQVNELRKLRGAAAVLEQYILTGKLDEGLKRKVEMESDVQKTQSLQNIQKKINEMSAAKRVRTILRIGWLFLHPDMAGSTIKNYWQQLLDETKAPTVKDLLAQIDNEMSMDKKFLAKEFVNGKLNTKSTFEKAHEWSLTEEENTLRDISRYRIKSLLHILRVNESQNSNIISDISEVSSMLNVDISASNTGAIDRQFKRAMLPLNAFYEKRYGKAYTLLKEKVEKYLQNTEDKGRISALQLFNDSLDLLSIFEKQAELTEPLFLKVSDVPRKLYSFLDSLQKSIDASGEKIELPVNKVNPTFPQLYNIIFYLNNNIYTKDSSPEILTRLIVSSQSKRQLEDHITSGREKRYNLYMIISGNNIEISHNIPLITSFNVFNLLKNNKHDKNPIYMGSVTPPIDYNTYPKLDKHIGIMPENATPFDYKLIAFIALILFQNL